MNQDLAIVKAWIDRIWAASLGIVIAFLLGIGSGVLIVENRIIDDCKFSNVFRVGIQVFSCQRKL